MNGQWPVIKLGVHGVLLVIETGLQKKWPAIEPGVIGMVAFIEPDVHVFW